MIIQERVLQFLTSLDFLPWQTTLFSEGGRCPLIMLDLAEAYIIEIGCLCLIHPWHMKIAFILFISHAMHLVNYEKRHISCCLDLAVSIRILVHSNSAQLEIRGYD